ncbi:MULTISPECIES: ABC transporter ATP-binding protein [Haloferacaceae]|uniref:ABC transporter ATP-binding protein n=1 Tax=Halorubrum glutamatedens TaxID=2707018 RepID=A0ABD5QRQ4_9EURY|nr:ABC transporter ATP-binding protein [Halobellus captivus]
MTESELMNQRSAPSDEPILSVEGLTTHYETDDVDSVVQAAENVSFTVSRGQTIGLVGESGCGKSTVGLSLLRALPPQGSIVDGSVYFDGQDLTTFKKKEIKKIQWNRISMIYQGAQNAFNPVKTIDTQIREALAKHDVVPKNQRRERIEELLQKVDLDPGVADRYPHELSGGMKQRAAIAMAISCEPDLLIADEPTTALDVVVQAKVLRMLLDLQEEFNFGMVVISHNLAAIMKVSDDIGVMYAGNMVERSSAENIFEDPQHPYTAKLFGSIIDPQRPPKQVENIPGVPPDLRNPPDGCRFADRCDLATEECSAQMPAFEPKNESTEHLAACFHSEEVSR